MKNIINNIKNYLPFILVNSLRNVLGIIRSKIIAISFGVDAIGVLGQYISFYNLQIKIVTCGTTASLINSYNNTKIFNCSSNQALLINFLIISFSNLLNLCFLIIFKEALTNLIFENSLYGNLISLTIVLNILFSISSFLELISQAKKQFKILSTGRIIAIIAAIIFVIPLTYYYSVYGVVIDFILLYSISFIYFFMKLDVVKKLSFIDIKKKILQIPSESYFLIIKFALTDLVRSVIFLLSLLIVRIIIVKIFSITEAGYYQAVISTSGYINVILEGFIVYYYPVISSLVKPDEIIKEVNKNFSSIMLIIAPILIILINFSSVVITLFFSDEFKYLGFYLSLILSVKMFNLFYYFFSVNFLAKNMLKKFILLDLIRSLFLITLTFFFIKYFSFESVFFALIITEIISTFAAFILKRKTNFFKLTKTNSYNFFVLTIIIALNILPFSPFIKIPVSVLFAILFIKGINIKAILERF